MHSATCSQHGSTTTRPHVTTTLTSSPATHHHQSHTTTSLVSPQPHATTSLMQPPASCHHQPHATTSLMPPPASRHHQPQATTTLTPPPTACPDACFSPHLLCRRRRWTLTVPGAALRGTPPGTASWTTAERGERWCSERREREREHTHPLTCWSTRPTLLPVLVLNDFREVSRSMGSDSTCQSFCVGRPVTSVCRKLSSAACTDSA